jgi:general secretion pathway protein K
VTACGAARRRQRGFALLIVLWSMALLALIGTRITAAGHAETRLAANLRAAAEAEAAADAAVFEAVWHAMDGSANRWPADGLARVVRLPHATVEVAMVSENSKITLNNSPLPLLHGLLHALGFEPKLAEVLTEQISDWRSPAQFPQRMGAKAPQYRAAGRDWGPPGQPFRSVDELGLVLSITPEILARLRPYVSPYIESTPHAGSGDRVIAAAAAEAAANGSPPLAFDEAPTLTITATAVTPSGGRFVRRAVIQVATGLASNPNQPPFTVLDWDRAPD